MNQKLLSQQAGFSMIEVMIVTVIISIVVVFAIIQTGSATGDFQIQNMAKELKVNLERARFDSVKRRPSNAVDMARVVISNPNSFSITTDLNGNGSIETFETKAVDLRGQTDIRIVGNGLFFPVTVMFNRRGYITATDSFGNAITPNFIVCENCTAGTANADNSFIVSVSPIGTVSMYRVGEDPQTPNNPTVTNISPASDIDPMVAVY